MMKRWNVALAAVLVAVLVAASRGLFAQAATPLPPIEVGKIYGFGVSGSDLAGKVLEEPCGPWLKVEVRDGDKVHSVWLNLLQVSYVQPDPPAKKECPT